MRRGKGKAAAPQFDLVTSLSKKECAAAALIVAHPFRAAQDRSPPARPIRCRAPSRNLLCRNRMIKKHESMIQYHLARVPFYNGMDSPEMATANSLKEKIAKLGARRHATAAR